MCFTSDAEGIFLSDVVVRARKQHRCDECFTAIMPGMTYTRRGLLYDHRVSTFRACSACVRKAELIYEREIAEGCAPYESHPAWGCDEIAGYLADRGLRYDVMTDALCDKDDDAAG